MGIKRLLTLVTLINKMKFIKVLLFSVFFTSLAYSQPYINIINFQVGKYEPSKVYKGSDEWKIRNDYSEFGINVPIKFNAKQLLLISPRWMQKNYFSESTIMQNQIQNSSVVLEGASTYESTYNSLMIPLTWIQTLKDSTKKIILSGIYRFNYKKGIDPSYENDQLGGAILYSKKASKKFGWSAGLYYNRETFGDLYLPLIGIDWHPTDRIFCWATLPQFAVVDYTIAPTIHVGFGFRGIQESYTEIGIQNYFTFSEGQLRLYAEYYLPRTNFVITFEAGNTIAREFIFFNSDYVTNEETKIYPTESMFGRIGISYRITTDKSFKTKPSPSH
jgi:hypothetical protein